ncbi:MAG: hypothetical protein JST92_18410 [Deltaproteobacteria bacterium]|nr:hypothetical protein [Deltaproteobacteria bacterium]
MPDGERVQPADALAFEEFLLAQGAPAQPAAAGPLATYELDLAERTHVHEHAGPHAPGAHSHAPGAPHGHSHGPGQSHGSGALQHFAAALESTLALPAYALELPQFAPPAVEQPQTLTLPSWLRPARAQAPPRV